MTKIGHAGTLVALGNGLNTLVHTVWPVIAPLIHHLPHLEAPDLILNDVKTMERDINAVREETFTFEQVVSFNQRTVEIMRRYAFLLGEASSAIASTAAATSGKVIVLSQPATSSMGANDILILDPGLEITPSGRIVRTSKKESTAVTQHEIAGEPDVTSC